MVNEETGNGFFSRLKSVFSSSANTGTHEDTAHENSTATLTEEAVMHEEVVEPVTETVNTTVVRNENMTGKEMPVRAVEVSAPAVYTLPDEQDLDIRFATKFIEAGGKFVFCETMKEAIESLKMLKTCVLLGK